MFNLYDAAPPKAGARWLKCSGACRHRRVLVARLPTSATRRRRIGASGRSRKTDASCQPTASPSTRRSRTSETKKKDVVWFALNEDLPLFAFAGIWTVFKGGDWGTKSKL